MHLNMECMHMHAHIHTHTHTHTQRERERERERERVLHNLLPPNGLHTVGYFLLSEQPNTLQHPLVRRFKVQCPMTATHHQPVGPSRLM